MAEDKRFEILIAFGLKDEAAKEAIGQMDSLKAGAKETSGETLGLSQATEKYIERLKEQSGSVEGLTEKKHALRSILRSLGPEFSHLAHAAPMFLNPATAGVAALVLGVGLLKNHLDEVADAEVALRDADFLDRISTATHSLPELNNQLGELATKLDMIRDRQTTIKEKADEDIQALKESATAANAVAKAKLDLAVSELKLKAAREGMPDDQLQAQLSRLQEVARQSSGALGIETAKKVLAMREKERSEIGLSLHDERLDSLPSLQYSAHTAKQVADDRQREIADVDARIKYRQEIQGKLSGPDAEYNSNFRQQLYMLRFQLEERLKLDSAAAKKAQATFDDASAKAQALTTRFRELEDEITTLKRQLASSGGTEAAVNKAKAGGLSAEISERALKSDLGVMLRAAANAAIQSQANSRQFSARDRVPLTPEQAANIPGGISALEGAASMLNASSRGQKLNVDQQRFIQEMISVLSALNANQVRALETASVQHNNTRANSEGIAQLNAQVIALQSQLQRKTR